MDKNSIISLPNAHLRQRSQKVGVITAGIKELVHGMQDARSEEHTSELQSQSNLVCRLLLEKKKTDLLEVGLDVREARSDVPADLYQLNHVKSPAPAVRSRVLVAAQPVVRLHVHTLVGLYSR